MKKLNIYKSTLAILSLSSIALFSGCSLNSADAQESTPDQINSQTSINANQTSCGHLTVYFDNQPITFKECEGYDLSVHTYQTSGHLYYDVYKNDKKIIVDGITSLANYYEVYHEVANEIINNESVQKVK